MVLNSCFIFVLICTIVKSQSQNDIDSIFGNTNNCSVIEKKTNLEKPCEFPFIYENKTFYGCTTYLKLANGKEKVTLPWCSTKTEAISHEHIPGGKFWGECPKDNTDTCPSAEQGQEAANLWEDIQISESSKIFLQRKYSVRNLIFKLDIFLRT